MNKNKRDEKIELTDQDVSNPTVGDKVNQATVRPPQEQTVVCEQDDLSRVEEPGVSPETRYLQVVTDAVSITSNITNRLVDWQLLDEVSKSSTITKELRARIEMAGKDEFAKFKAIRTVGDGLTVYIYWHIGGLLTNANAKLKSFEFDLLQRQMLGDKKNIDETARQMERLFAMGPEVLRFARLGKNRCLELYYLFVELPEYAQVPDRKEFIQKQLRNIENRCPWPIGAEMDELTVKEFRVWLDAVITTMRIEKATGDTNLCSFETAHHIATVRHLAVEIDQANGLARKLDGIIDPDRRQEVLQDWVDGLQEKEESSGQVKEQTPDRIFDALSTINIWYEKHGIGSVVAELRINPSDKGVVIKAYNAIKALYDQIQADGQVEAITATGGAA